MSILGALLCLRFDSLFIYRYKLLLSDFKLCITLCIVMLLANSDVLVGKLSIEDERFGIGEKGMNKVFDANLLSNC